MKPLDSDDIARISKMLDDEFRVHGSRDFLGWVRHLIDNLVLTRWDRDAWRSRALDQHPAVVALRGERDGAHARAAREETATLAALAELDEMRVERDAAVARAVRAEQERDEARSRIGELNVDGFNVAAGHCRAKLAAAETRAEVAEARLKIEEATSFREALLGLERNYVAMVGERDAARRDVDKLERKLDAVMAVAVKLAVAADNVRDEDIDAAAALTQALSDFGVVQMALRMPPEAP